MLQKLSVVLTCLFLSSCSIAHPPSHTHYLPVDENLQLAMALQGTHWKLSREAPPSVARRMTEHLRRELLDAGRRLEEDQLLQLARRRLAVNEGYVFNDVSDAFLMIDFSPQRSAAAPTHDDLRSSGYGALLALKNESGVSRLEGRVKTARVAGGNKACRVEARYLLDEKARLFIGIIGHRTPYRFYFYYNDSLQKGQDRGDMEQILRSMELQAVP